MNAENLVLWVEGAAKAGLGAAQAWECIKGMVKERRDPNGAEWMVATPLVGADPAKEGSNLAP